MGLYTGRVTKPVSADGKSGWIAVASVQKKLPTTEGLKTTEDIFVHMDCIRNVKSLTVGMEIDFFVAPDTKRGEGTYRIEYGSEETDRSKTERFANGGITLNVQGLGDSHVLEQPSVFVRWCISPEVAAQLREKRLSGCWSKPYLLIVEWAVDTLGRMERRYLFDLDDPGCMGVIEFNRGGRHRIIAIMTPESDLLVRHGGSYDTDVINYSGDGIRERIAYIGSTCFDVEIPRELFAEKPRDWAWVNRWYDEPPFDQCQFRRRCVFAYTVQPVLFVLGYLLGGLVSTVGWLCSLLIAIILLIVGMRRINTEPLLHPWLKDPREVWRQTSGGSVFWPLVEGQRVSFAILLHPVLWVAVWFFAKRVQPTNMTAEPDLFLAVALICSALCMTTSLSILIRRMRAFDKTREMQRIKKLQEQAKARRAAQEERAIREAEARRVRIEQEVAALICDATTPREASIKHIPFTHRTLKFYFEDLKRKVCRPFSA